MPCAVCPQGVGTLQSAGGREAVDSERAQPGLERGGGFAGQGGALNAAAPVAEKLWKSVQIVHPLNADSAAAREQAQPDSAAC